jgi:hypothetical protein
MREELRLRVFENRALRRIFWCKRDEVTGEWRKLHNEELNPFAYTHGRDTCELARSVVYTHGCETG